MKKETVWISGVTCLAEFRHENAELRPLDFGRSESCETCTESMKIEPVADARRAILFLIAGADRPFSPWSRNRKLHMVGDHQIQNLLLPCPG